MIAEKTKKIFLHIKEWLASGLCSCAKRLKENPYVKKAVDYINPRAQWLMLNFITWVRSFNRNDPEVEFYPAALEVLETPPSPAGRAISGVIILFFLLALAWACIGTVDIIATAQGKIIPTGRTKIIQPLEAGVVRAIHVHDGQTVKAGDTLIEIDSTINESERDRLHAEYIAAALDVARLKALSDLNNDPLKQFSPPEDAGKSQIATQKSLLSNQVEEIRAKLSGIDSQIAQNEGNLAAVTATIEKLTKSIPMLKERAEMHQYLSGKGYGSKLDALTSEQDMIEHEQELKVQQGRLDEATGALESLKEQRKQAEAEFQRANLDKLSEAEQKAASLHEEWLQASQKFRLQTLKAPVDGTVQQLAVHTEGGVVTPAQALLAIVPADSHIEIEAMVSNRDIGFVHDGQDVEVKVDTFNFTRYGLLHGRVISVSQDAIVRDKPQSGSGRQSIGAENDSSELQGQELIYAARIALEETQMDIDGRMVSLSPGMAVTAEIKTGSRHIIEYLLSPLRKHMQQSLREQ
jgi:hemolysin D